MLPIVRAPIRSFGCGVSFKERPQVPLSNRYSSSVPEAEPVDGRGRFRHSGRSIGSERDGVFRSPSETRSRAELRPREVDCTSPLQTDKGARSPRRIRSPPSAMLLSPIFPPPQSADGAAAPLSGSKNGSNRAQSGSGSSARAVAARFRMWSRSRRSSRGWRSRKGMNPV